MDAWDGDHLPPQRTVTCVNPGGKPGNTKAQHMAGVIVVAVLTLLLASPFILYWLDV